MADFNEMYREVQASIDSDETWDSDWMPGQPSQATSAQQAGTIPKQAKGGTGEEEEPGPSAETGPEDEDEEERSVMGEEGLAEEPEEEGAEEEDRGKDEEDEPQGPEKEDTEQDQTRQRQYRAAHGQTSLRSSEKPHHKLTLSLKKAPRQRQQRQQQQTNGAVESPKVLAKMPKAFNHGVQSFPGQCPGQYLYPSRDVESMLKNPWEPALLFPVLNTETDVQTHYIPGLHTILDNPVHTSYLNHPRKYTLPDKLAKSMSEKEKGKYLANRYREDPLYYMILTHDKNMVYGITVHDLKRESRRWAETRPSGGAATWDRRGASSQWIYKLMRAVTKDIVEVCAYAQDPTSIPSYTMNAVFPLTKMQPGEGEDEGENEGQDEGEGENPPMGDDTRRKAKRWPKKPPRTRVIPVYVLPFFARHMGNRGNMTHFFHTLLDFAAALAVFGAKKQVNECYGTACAQLRGNALQAARVRGDAIHNPVYQERARTKAYQSVVHGQKQISKQASNAESHVHRVEERERKLEDRMDLAEESIAELRACVRELSEENARLRGQNSAGGDSGSAEAPSRKRKGYFVSKTTLTLTK